MKIGVHYPRVSLDAPPLTKRQRTPSTRLQQSLLLSSSLTGQNTLNLCYSVVDWLFNVLLVLNEAQVCHSNLLRFLWWFNSHFDTKLVAWKNFIVPFFKVGWLLFCPIFSFVLSQKQLWFGCKKCGCIFRLICDN